VVRDWLSAIDVRAPGDLGLVQLERRRGCADWSGMEQHNDLTGGAAIDMLVSLLHNEELGLPIFPRATLIGASWSDGNTTRTAGNPPATSPASTARRGRQRPA
jgi:LacI family transcriptional regulator